MSLVDRLKRAVLSVLGIGREDWSSGSSTSTDEGESTSRDTATDNLDVESGTIESDDAEDGGRTTTDSEGGTQIGEEPDGEAESESSLTEPESESKPPEEEEPVEADESKAGEISESEGDEKPGIDLGEEAAPAPEEEAADTSEVEEPGTEEKPAESETGEPEVELDTGEQEAESVAEESGSETEEPDTGFEFEEAAGESESAEPDQEPESAVEESESEAAESGSLETESESGEPESSIREDGSDVEESIPDKPETTTEPDDEDVATPETDEAEEELEPSLKEEESEEKDPSESTEIETDSIDVSGSEAEDGSASEGADIDIFDEEFEPVESDSGGQEPDSTVEPEPDDLPTGESETDQESSTSTTTSERQIPYALDPEGNEVHVDDAEEGKPYICKECEWPLKLGTSDKIQNYFAHKRGGPNDCSLKSESTPPNGRDTEEQRQLPVFFSHSTRSALLGEIPALKIDDFDDPVNIPTELENIQVGTQGTQDNPQPDWFRPTKSRIDVRLDPDADEYQITVDSDGRFESIEGDWYASGLEPGDVFVGEKAQAERMKTESPVVKEGQWVYVVLDNLPETVPDAAEIYRAGSRDILGVEVKDDTLGLLQQYADVEASEEASFRAHVLIPPDVDPRSETVHDPPGTEVLIGIQPTGESDTEFHILVLGNKERNTVIDTTGEGTPRFHATEIPQDGSDRREIHGLGESESIELTAQDEQDESERSWTGEPIIGVHVGDGDGDTQLLDPIRGPTSHTFGPDIDADAITDSIAFEGPDGYRFDLKAEFPDDIDFASVLRRSEVTAEEARTAISTWIRESCDRIEIDFDAAGKIELVFDRELDCRVVLEAAVTIYDVEEEEDAINIAVPKVGRMLNPDLSYVEINAPDVPCPHCGEEHRPAFVAADTGLVRLELNMDVRGVENSVHAERIAKAEIGKRIQSIPLKTVEIERL